MYCFPESNSLVGSIHVCETLCGSKSVLNGVEEPASSVRSPSLRIAAVRLGRDREPVLVCSPASPDS